MTMVVEGIRTCEAAHSYGQKHNIDMPIINSIYDIIFAKKDPEDVFKKLLERSMKPE
jgi:glycerol-3-phosphate dehydrogenase (NAD(P)+)